MTRVASIFLWAVAPVVWGPPIARLLSTVAHSLVVITIVIRRVLLDWVNSIEGVCFEEGAIVCCRPLIEFGDSIEVTDWTWSLCLLLVAHA